MYVEDFDLSLIFLFLYDDLISHSGHLRVMEGAVMCVQNITAIFSTTEKFHYVIISNVKACSNTDNWKPSSFFLPRRTIYFLKLNGLSNIC